MKYFDPRGHSKWKYVIQFSVDSGVNAMATAQILWKTLFALPVGTNLHHLPALYIFNLTGLISYEYDQN